MRAGLEKKFESKAGKAGKALMGAGIGSTTAYNLGLLGLMEATKSGFPPGFENSSLPSIIYEPCNCDEGWTFAHAMQDIFLNNQLLEGMVGGAIPGALLGSALGAVAGWKKASTWKGRIGYALGGAFLGGSLGATINGYGANMELMDNSETLFGPWEGCGVDRLEQAMEHGVGDVTNMVGIYPLFLAVTMGMTALAALYFAVKSAKPLIKQGREFSEQINQ